MTPRSTRTPTLTTTTSKSAPALSAVLPFSPIPSPRPRVVVRGKFPSVYMPSDYMDWKKDVAAYVQDVGLAAPEGLFEAPVSLDLICHVERPKTSKLLYPKPDVDNYAKSVMDAFNDSGRLWKDDCQVHDLRVRKRWAEGEPGVSFTLTYET